MYDHQKPLKVPLLKATGMTKSFFDNTVLEDVDLTIYNGEVHSIVGENGAGKSTLIKLLGGVYFPDRGLLKINDKTISFRSPREAIAAGIVAIHQEFSLTPHLSAEENIFLGHYPTTSIGLLDKKKMREQAIELIDRLSVKINPSTPVGLLSVAQQQMIEIAKALSLDAKILILDEPTAVLDEDNVKTLFQVIKKLKSEGLGIIFISHHLDEIFSICDKVTVLRDGKITGSESVKNIDHDWLVKHMIGRDFIAHTTSDHKIYDTALRIENLSSYNLFQNINLDIKKGEIVSLAGLVGAGRTEVAEAIFGIRRISAGKIYIFGKERKIRGARAAIKLGISYVTEDRKKNGLFLNRSVTDNLTISSLKKFVKFFIMDLKKESEFTSEIIKKLDIRLSRVQQNIENLSGGNQQKVLIGRALVSNPRVLILDEPTRGVDIAAKQEIYSFIQQLVEQGIAILLISSELDEVLLLSDRILVLRKGQVVAKLNRSEANEENIMKAAALSVVIK
ncbi:MAG: sugar ABC transporter ATP-binding protein [Spirochaetaceae bacterium]|jgi:ABC-type sugar transport system ATPase subunit|nr:sugar ABC transporter ATP-binding protein [Spirochaetaceae bacterium]